MHSTISSRNSTANPKRSQQNANIKSDKSNSNKKTSSSNTSGFSAPSNIEKLHFKHTNRENEINNYNKILDVRKATDKMNFIYPSSSASTNELTRRKQKHLQACSTTSFQAMSSRCTKSARTPIYKEQTYSLLKPVESMPRFNFKSPASNQPHIERKQSSINTVLCQKCLRLHLDRCSLCFNDSSLDVSDNEYYYNNAIESSGKLTIGFDID